MKKKIGQRIPHKEVKVKTGENVNNLFKNLLEILDNQNSWIEERMISPLHTPHILQKLLNKDLNIKSKLSEK
ncbi:MAG: hypothetical protein ACFE68_05600 [Candidatus Hodarchaeota archaeon]